MHWGRNIVIGAPLVVGALLGLFPAVTAQATPGDPPVRCTDKTDDVHRLDIEIEGQDTWGLYALPDGRPQGLVMVGHGYGHTPESWRHHLAAMARESGVIAVAMNYRGSIDGDGTPANPTRGWRVQEGAEDIIHVAKKFDERCRGIPTVVLYGISMGANSTGLAAAAGATRVDSDAPLFDWWFAIEPAANVIETYHEARALSPSGNATAVRAVEDIEAEMGGTFEEVPDVYADHTVVRRVPDIAAAGVRGVVVVHGVGDGLVPYNQGRELTTALRAVGVPVEMYTAVTQTDDEPGTTLTGYVPNSPSSPFAGHGSEKSTKHLVVRTGLDRLRSFFAGRLLCDAELVVDGHLDPLGAPSC